MEPQKESQKLSVSLKQYIYIKYINKLKCITHLPAASDVHINAAVIIIQ